MVKRLTSKQIRNIQERKKNRFDTQRKQIMNTLAGVLPVVGNVKERVAKVSTHEIPFHHIPYDSHIDFKKAKKTGYMIDLTQPRKRRRR
jgi:formyltetrahydrofolate hydrolase